MYSSLCKYMSTRFMMITALNFCPLSYHDTCVYEADFILPLKTRDVV